MNNTTQYNGITQNGVPSNNVINNGYQNNIKTSNNPQISGNPYNTQPYVQSARIPVQESEEVRDFREKMARKLGTGSLIYAAIFTFCLYDNLTGITMPIFGIATLIYMVYALKLYDVKIKKLSWFYGAVIMSLTISNFLTGNVFFHFFNIIGIILMLFVFLLHNVYDDKRWNFSKTSIAFLESFFCSIGELDDFTRDMNVLKQRNKSRDSKTDRKHTFKYIMIGLIISVPFTGIILILLSEADKVFKTFMNKYLSFNIDFGNITGVIFTFAVSFFASYCILRFFSKKTIKEEVTSHRNLEPLVAITMLSIISVIYLFFSVIQIVYLFWGGLTLPDNYTYAQYAREGFFQLLAVSIINFLMVLFINNHFRENLILKILMTIISLCTYIMIASSFMRMILYIDAYLLTTLRILVLWSLVLLALLFAAVIISIFKNDFPQFRYSILVFCILYLILSFARPDYIIADYNLSHMNNEQNQKKISKDYDYLTGLSTDAAPVIYEYSGEWADDYFNQCKYYDDMGLRKLNLSVYTAKKLYEQR